MQCFVLGISRQHLHHPKLLVYSVYWFHVSFYVRIMQHHLGISLPHEDSSGKIKLSYTKSIYYSIFDDYGVNAHEIWMNGYWVVLIASIYCFWCCTEDYKTFLTRQTYTIIYYLFKWFYGEDIGKVSKFLQTFIYLVLTSQIQARFSTVGNSALEANAQHVFKRTFNALMNEDYSIRVANDMYQNVLEHASSKCVSLSGP